MGGSYVRIAATSQPLKVGREAEPLAEEGWCGGSDGGDGRRWNGGWVCRRREARQQTVVVGMVVEV